LPFDEVPKVVPAVPSIPQASDEQIKKRDELLWLLKEVEQKAEKIEDLGKAIVKSARLSRDVALPLRTLVSEMPASEFPTDRLDLLIKGWRSWHAGADRIEITSTNVNSFSALSLSTATSGTTVFSQVNLISFPSSISRQAVEQASIQLQLTFDQSSLLESVRSSMHRLGLDSRNEQFQTPLGMINESCGALDRPVRGDGGAVSVVIPLRESINAVISELLRRRPIQESAPKLRDKIMSLGQQCNRANLDEAHFERLGADAEVLLNDFSGVKQAKLSREGLKEFFNRGLLFLDALMTSIDENRLRGSAS
jgi:hypothetical protein